MTHAAYLHKALTDTNQIVDSAIKKLSSVPFEAFVCTGVSGALIAPILAFLMDKRMAVVRKESDHYNHSSRQVESTIEPGDRWIIVDDLSSSGHTLRNICGEMMHAGHDTSLNVGRYFYNSNEFYPGRWHGYN